MSVGAGCADGGFEGIRESVLGAEDRGEIVDTYDRGIEQLNDANRARDDGVVAFNEERYDDALGALETSIDRYTDAGASFRDAESMAETADVPPAAGICAEAAIHAETMEASTVEAREGVTAADAGESAAVINGHIETAKELQAEADESAVADPETLLDVLEADG